MKIRQACDIILEKLEKMESLRFMPLGDNKDIQALRMALQMKMGGDQRDAMALIEEIRQLLENDMLL